jgi:hypothetical protein
MLVNVLFDPLIDLLVKVWVAVLVVTVSPATLALVEAVSVVKAPERAVVAPMLMLLIVPAVVGFMVTAPEGLNVALVDALKVVKAPELAVVAPIAELSIVAPVNAPPVTVLPVKVKAAGSDRVTVVVPVAVISFAVPLMVVTAPIAEALIETFEAAVSWPWALTVNVPTCVLDPYDPAVTAVLAIEIVPMPVIGPPVRPVPVSTSVTPPDSENCLQAPAE